MAKRRIQEIRVDLALFEELEKARVRLEAAVAEVNRLQELALPELRKVNVVRLSDKDHVVTYELVTRQNWQFGKRVSKAQAALAAAKQYEKEHGIARPLEGSSYIKRTET